MKGVYYMDLLIWAIAAIVVFAIAFVVWDKVSSTAAVEGPRALEGVAAGAVLFHIARKKGIVITTSLLTSVVLITVVFFLILGIYLSLTAETGSTSSSFLFGILDALFGRLG